MEGAKIGAINDAMANFASEIKRIPADADWTISVITFSKKAEWMFPKPLPAYQFEWEEPLLSGGMTAMGAACQLLDSALSETSQNQNIIIIATDGCPTDDYEEAINNLCHNPRFNSADRYAIAIEPYADRQQLRKFVGNDSNIYNVENLSDLLDNIYNLSFEINNDTPSNTSTSNEDDWD